MKSRKTRSSNYSKPGPKGNRKPRRAPAPLADSEAVRRLRESEQRFGTLIELSAHWYWEQDAELRFTYMSPGVEKRLGLPAEAFLGRTRSDMVMFESESARREHLAALEARRPFEDVLLCQRRADGKRVYARVSGQPIFDEEGRFRGYRGVGRDVTAQVEAERALRESEARFRDLTELSSDWYWEQDENLRFTRISGGVLKKLGWDPQSFIGKSRWDFPILVDEAALAEHKALLAARKPFHDFVYGRRNSDGTLSYVSISGIALFDEHGDFRGYRGTGRDVTELKRREAEILRAREQLRLALVGSKLALFEWNIATGEVFLSERWAEMVGGPPGPTSTTMDELMRLVHPDDLQRVREFALRVVKGSVPFYDEELRMRTAAGGWIWVRSQGQIVERDASGLALRASGTNADVTQRKQAEEALREAHERLKRSVADLERRNREIAALSELSNALLSCLAVEEACHVIPKYGEMLFPAERGALFLMRNSRDRLNPCASWGAPRIYDGPALGPEQCWALRRGRVHVMQDPARDPVCEHARGVAGEGGPCLCLPLIVQSELIGLLWIVFRPGTRLSDERDAGQYGKHELAVSLSEQIALALSNIRLRESLRQQTIRDPLTGLYNRRFLEESLDWEIARCKRSGTGFAVLMIDVDHFKRFNDAYGHDAGDSVLRAVAACLRASTRESDIVCRFGGEEFVIVLPDTGLDGATTHARRILECVRNLRPVHAGRALPSITVSVGVAMYPENGDTMPSIVRSVDQALYAAKGAGRDQLAVAQ